jgi:hypothetical protein
MVQCVVEVFAQRAIAAVVSRSSTWSSARAAILANLRVNLTSFTDFEISMSRVFIKVHKRKHLVKLNKCNPSKLTLLCVCVCVCVCVGGSSLSVEH